MPCPRVHRYPGLDDQLPACTVARSLRKRHVSDRRVIGVDPALTCLIERGILRCSHRTLAVSPLSFPDHIPFPSLPAIPVFGQSIPGRALFITETAPGGIFPATTTATHVRRSHNPGSPSRRRCDPFHPHVGTRTVSPCSASPGSRPASPRSPCALGPDAVHPDARQ